MLDKQDWNVEYWILWCQEGGGDGGPWLEDDRDDNHEREVDR